MNYGDFDRCTTPRVVVKETIPANACAAAVPSGTKGVIVPWPRKDIPDDVVVVKFEASKLGYREDEEKFLYLYVKETNLKPAPMSVGH